MGVWVDKIIVNFYVVNVVIVTVREYYVSRS